MQNLNIAEAKTAELIAFYNANVAKVGGTEVKKFADRATAEKRVSALIEHIAAMPAGDEAATEGTEPAETVETNTVESTDGAPEGTEQANAEEEAPETEEETREEDEAAAAARAAQGAGAFSMLQGVLNAMNQAQANGEKPAPVVRSTSPKASNSDGVAASWVDSEVRAARLKRDGVQVELDGKPVGTYKSTRDAFRANRLPDNKHIRFRLKLKEAHRVAPGSSEVFEHNGKKYVFTIVELAAE